VVRLNYTEPVIGIDSANGVTTLNVTNRTLTAGLPHINPGNKEHANVFLLLKA
jgi:hypothetical protein